MENTVDVYWRQSEGRISPLTTLTEIQILTFSKSSGTKGTLTGTLPSGISLYFSQSSFESIQI